MEFVALYGAEHVSGAAQFRVFSLLLLARVTNFTFVSLALGQPRVPFVAASIAMTFNVALSFVFVHTLGMIGPAVANVVAIYLSTIYTLHAIRVALGVSWREMFPLRRYLATLGLATLAGVVALAVLVPRLPPLVTMIAGALVLLGVFAALASATGLLTASDWRFVDGVVRLRFLRSTPLSTGAAPTPDRSHPTVMPAGLPVARPAGFQWDDEASSATPTNAPAIPIARSPADSKVGWASAVTARPPSSISGSRASWNGLRI